MSWLGGVPGKSKADPQEGPQHRGKDKTESPKAQPGKVTRGEHRRGQAQHQPGEGDRLQPGEGGQTPEAAGVLAALPPQPRPLRSSGEGGSAGLTRSKNPGGFLRLSGLPACSETRGAGSRRPGLSRLEVTEKPGRWLDGSG